MNGLCRLCAESKPLDKMSEINDPELDLEQKLIVCCRWKTFVDHTNEDLPQQVCIMCIHKVEQSWEFAQSVAFAQHKLLEMIENSKLVPFDPSDEHSQIDISVAENYHFFQNTDFIDDFSISDDVADDNEFIDIGETKPNLFGEKEQIKTRIEICGENNQQTDDVVEFTALDETSNFRVLRKRRPQIPIKTYASKKQRKASDAAGESNSGQDERAANAEKVQAKELMRVEEVDEMIEATDRIKSIGVEKTTNIQKSIEAQNTKQSETDDKPEELSDGEMSDVEPNVSTSLIDFLELLKDDDRNDDGTVKPETIARLKLENWMIVQHQCWICSTCIGDYYKLKKHITTEHPNEKIRHVCSLCMPVKTLTYARRFTLFRHTAKKHFPHLDYCCVKCNKFYWDLKKLQTHFAAHAMRPYQNETPLLCDVCGKVCESETSLRQHQLQSHLPPEIRPTFECYMCRKRFANKLSLTHHMPDHLGQRKKFECNICHKDFTRKDALKRHQQTHLDSEPFVCSQCNKGFKMKQRLKIHMQIHTNFKRFACPYCDYRSVDSSNIYKHVRQKHGLPGQGLKIQSQWPNSGKNGRKQTIL